jgi:hypothetical protein
MRYESQVRSCISVQVGGRNNHSVILDDCSEVIRRDETSQNCFLGVGEVCDIDGKSGL